MQGPVPWLLFGFVMCFSYFRPRPHIVSFTVPDCWPTARSTPPDFTNQIYLIWLLVHLSVCFLFVVCRVFTVFNSICVCLGELVPSCLFRHLATPAASANLFEQPVWEQYPSLCMLVMQAPAT